jgi:hypothetical protein
MTGIDYARLDGAAALEILDELADVHQRIYTEPPYNDASKYGRHQFLQRTRHQAQTTGFTLVTARRDGALAGFTFGFTMTPGLWWSHAGPPSPDLLHAISNTRSASGRLHRRPVPVCSPPRPATIRTSRRNCRTDNPVNTGTHSTRSALTTCSTPTPSATTAKR